MLPMFGYQQLTFKRYCNKIETIHSQNKLHIFGVMSLIMRSLRVTSLDKLVSLLCLSNRVWKNVCTNSNCKMHTNYKFFWSSSLYTQNRCPGFFSSDSRQQSGRNSKCTEVDRACRCHAIIDLIAKIKVWQSHFFFKSIVQCRCWVKYFQPCWQPK